MGTSFIALTILKLATALGASTGLITAVKWFNTYEFKTTKKGGYNGVSNDVDHLRERIRPKY